MRERIMGMLMERRLSLSPYCALDNMGHWVSLVM